MSVVIVNGIVKKFRIGHRKDQSALARICSWFLLAEQKREFEVLKDISFTIKKGEIVGIIGGNGSGKSTLLRIIAGIYRPDRGVVKSSGKIVPLIGLGLGLRERLTMGENIFLIGAFLGMSREEIKKVFPSIVRFSGLEQFVFSKIYQFSSGMIQRLIFSIAVHAEPDILLLDEVFEVGDEDFKKKSGDKIQELVASGVAVILVSHDQQMIDKYCHRVFEMNNGLIKNVKN